MSKARQFIKDYTRSCSNIEYTQGVYTPSYHPWLTPEQALAAVEIAREELIEKACEWLNNFYSEDRHCYLVAEDIKAFKQAMGEQL